MLYIGSLRVYTFPASIFSAFSPLPCFLVVRPIEVDLAAKLADSLVKAVSWKCVRLKEAVDWSAS